MKNQCFFELCLKRPELHCNCEGTNTLMCHDHNKDHLQRSKGPHQITNIFSTIDALQQQQLLKIIKYKLEVYTELESTIKNKANKLISEICIGTHNSLEIVLHQKTNLFRLVTDINNGLIETDSLTDLEKDKNNDFIIECSFPNIEPILSSISSFFSQSFSDLIVPLPHFSQSLRTSGRLEMPSPSLLSQSFKSSTNTQEKLNFLKSHYNLDIWHPGYVYCTIPLRNSQYFLSGGGDGNIIMWDLSSKSLHQCIPAHTNKVKCLAATSDNKYLISGSDDRSIKVWDLSGMVEIGRHRMESSAACIEITSDDKLAVVGNNNGGLCVWNFEKGVVEGEIRDSGGWASWIGMAAVQQAGVVCMKIHGDNETAVTGHSNGYIMIWDLKKRCLKTTVVVQDFVNAVILSTNSILVTCGGDGLICLWKLNGAKLASLAGHIGRINTMCITSDNQFLISGGTDCTIKVWNFYNQNQEYEIVSHTKAVTHLAITPDNKYLVSGGRDGLIIVYNLVQRTIHREIPVHVMPICDLKLSDTGNFAYSCSGDGYVRVIRVLNGVKHNCSFRGHRGIVEHVELSSDWRSVVSGGSDGTVRLWNLETRKQELRLNQHSCISGYAFIDKIRQDCDGKYVISRSSGDKSIIIFSIEDKHEIAKINTLDELNAMAGKFRELKEFRSYF